MSRKASDVILNIEAQNEEILGFVRSINHKLSLALNRMNLHDAVQPAPTVAPPKLVPAPQPPSVEAPEGVSDTFKVRSTRQQVVYAVDGKPVPIAKVQIFNSQGEKVKETRTGPSGKWEAKLAPGEYGVHIAKVKVRTYPLVNVQSEFTAAPGSEPQILERIEIS